MRFAKLFVLLVVGSLASWGCTTTQRDFAGDGGASSASGAGNGGAGSTTSTGGITCATNADCGPAKEPCVEPVCTTSHACATIASLEGTTCSAESSIYCDGLGKCNRACMTTNDCKGSEQCVAFQCVTPSTCTNGLKDGDETDIDCGGSCSRCPVGRGCASAGDCASYQCTNNACTPCTAASCPAGIVCDPATQVCLNVSNQGAPCTGDAACSSTHCVDGVCCESACNGSGCKACANVMTGAPDGTCAAVVSGTDPHGQCGPCQRCGNGVCAPFGGQGSCEQCTNGIAVQGQCDATGTCSGAQVDCSPYVCDPSHKACLSTCQQQSDCVPGTTCSPASAKCM